MSDTVAYRGLTWDHPRGFNALDAAARAHPELGLSWAVHSLEGFETHPIADLCDRYDLVVLDHPHVGEAVDGQCLVPLEDLFSADEIAGWQRDCIGPSLASYNFAGRHWALPLDAATQVMACHPSVGDIPRTWDDVLAFDGPVALSLAGPHAALSFQSICAALGERPAMADPDIFISLQTGLAAFDLMQRLTDASPLSVRDLNPIRILQHMVDHDDVALCPLIYGYVNYANRLTFANAPRGNVETGGIGSTLGGTGIGISKRCRMTPQLLDHLRWLMLPQAQVDFIPAHDGQPSLRAAWRDAGVNARWGGFYANTFDTLEAAYVRPRHNRAIAFQTEASARLRAALFEHGDPAALLNDLQTAYARTRVPGTER
ncbi:carbohydrate ABC transporter substrate-binding protein [Asticcacaulis sp. 201]|uniref:carbohydrate ABC transporter substrate-binding protein n=1 Tax=Asticcacaulis sp. 201 TaxID=3028787 RepID=UPI0029169224|nr:carbohydrate ABC transporter substrate-binding protein [Asticcacaulis sp. 201]MDV6330385.1 carbohydrate ABC transporter substrate-binding protein [Asticcacaulis sp. 201]